MARPESKRDGDLLAAGGQQSSPWPASVAAPLRLSGFIGELGSSPSQRANSKRSKSAICTALSVPTIQPNKLSRPSIAVNR